ncbi:MAG TPA: hypothetical protein VFD90_03670 [Gaiellales bacterium]|nr:hypothetical protein [Gaiellales bacterium]
MATSLLATGLGLLRHATWTLSVASSAATLLVCDAWFDVTLSSSGREQLVALTTAALVEVPLAVACVFVARESEQMADRARRYVSLVRPVHFRRRGAPLPSRAPVIRDSSSIPDATEPSANEQR